MQNTFMPLAWALFLCAVVFGFMPGSLSAQGREKPKPRQQITFLVFSPGGDDSATEERTFTLDTEGGPALVSFYPGSGNRGPFVRPMADKLELYAMVAPVPAVGASAGGGGVQQAPVKSLVANLDLPTDSRSVLVLVAGANAAKPASLRVIDIAETNIPAGQIKVINFTAKRCALRVGTQVTQLAPRESGLIPAVTKSGRAGRVARQLALEANGEWEVVDSSAGWAEPAGRMIYLIMPNGPNSATINDIGPLLKDPAQPEAVPVRP